MRLALFLGLGLVLASGALAALVARPAEAATPTKQERALLRAVNTARANHHLPRLRLQNRLQKGAHAYARTLLRRNLFVHAHLPAGVGETLAWGSKQRLDPRTIVQLWLGSPSHRAVILWPNARYAGFGVSNGWFRDQPSVRLAVARLGS